MKMCKLNKSEVFEVKINCVKYVKYVYKYQRSANKGTTSLCQQFIDWKSMFPRALEYFLKNGIVWIHKSKRGSLCFLDTNTVDNKCLFHFQILHQEMTVWLWGVTTTPTWKSAVNFFTGHGKLDVGFAELTFSFVVTPTMLEDCPTLTDVSICCDSKRLIEIF